MILAILGYIPTHPRRVVRVDTFAKFQQLCGMLEQESYLVGHAACHATMNGFERVLAKDIDATDGESVREGVEALLSAGPFDALIMPGPHAPSIQKALLDACASPSADFTFRLFLDPPRGADIDQIIDWQKALPPFAAYAYPWVLTHTPTRRAPEVLPPSCLMPALTLGIAPHLRGVHEADTLRLDDALALAEGGVETMIASGKRSVLIRLQPDLYTEPPHAVHFEDVMGLPLPPEPPADPRQAKIERDEAAIETMLLEQIELRCNDVLAQATTNNAALWSTLTRTATSVLRDAQSRGFITKFHVRCDEETASWGSPTVPVVEILIAFAQRVRQVKFRTLRMK